MTKGSDEDMMITYRGKDIETLEREDLLECIRFAKKSIDKLTSRDLERDMLVFS